MVRTLCLLRHAKSDWTEPSLPDHDRPLAPRGERAALAIGRVMAQRGLQPDAVLCSSARRAVETAALAASQWDPVPPIEYDRALYLTGPARLLERIRASRPAVTRLLLVAHNPDLQLLALMLARPTDSPLRRRLAAGFPTATLAVLGLPAPSWAAVVPGSATIEDVISPRDLP